MNHVDKNRKHCTLALCPVYNDWLRPGNISIANVIRCFFLKCYLIDNSLTVYCSLSAAVCEMSLLIQTEIFVISVVLWYESFYYIMLVFRLFSRSFSCYYIWMLCFIMSMSCMSHSVCSFVSCVSLFSLHWRKKTVEAISMCNWIARAVLTNLMNFLWDCILSYWEVFIIFSLPLVYIIEKWIVKHALV